MLIASTPIAGPYDLSLPTPGQAFVKSLLYTGIAACVVFPADHTDRAGPSAVLGGKVGHIAGDISYGVFVYHLIVLSLVQQIFGQHLVQREASRLSSGRLSSCRSAVAAASYYGMERPIMRRGRHDRSYDVSPVGRDSSANAQPNKIDDWTKPEVSPAPPSGQG